MRMHARRFILELTCLALALSIAHVRAVESQAPPPPPLDAIKEEVGLLLPVKIKDAALTLDREALTQFAQAEAKRAADRWKQDYGKEIPKPVERSDAVEFVLLSMLQKTRQSVPENSVGHGGTPDNFTRGFAAKDFDCNVVYSATRYSFALAEKTGPQRKLWFDEDEKLGIIVRFENPAQKLDLHFTVTPDGAFNGECKRDGNAIPLEGATFVAVLQSEPAKLQVHFLRPLTDLGVSLALHKYLPIAMAAATSGFGAPAPEHTKRADQLLERLKSEEAAEREAAMADLIKHFPFAVKYLSDAAEKADDPESKMRLAKVLAAHPGIAKALPWVRNQKLQEDHVYLLDLLAHVPMFKASARQRLTELYGKDYGDDPKDWPKNP